MHQIRNLKNKNRNSAMNSSFIIKFLKVSAETTELKVDNLFGVTEEMRKMREETLPLEQDALDLVDFAVKRLQDLGFRDMIYGPKDGTVVEAWRIGCTSFYKCYYQGVWPAGNWYGVDPDDGDQWVDYPVMFRLIPEDNE